MEVKIINAKHGDNPHQPFLVVPGPVEPGDLVLWGAFPAICTKEEGPRNFKKFKEKLVPIEMGEEEMKVLVALFPVFKSYILKPILEHALAVCAKPETHREGAFVVELNKVIGSFLEGQKDLE